MYLYVLSRNAVFGVSGNRCYCCLRGKSSPCRDVWYNGYIWPWVFSRFLVMRGASLEASVVSFPRLFPECHLQCRGVARRNTRYLVFFFLFSCFRVVLWRFGCWTVTARAGMLLLRWFPIVLAACSVRLSDGYSSGAPDAACGGMIPRVSFYRCQVVAAHNWCLCLAARTAPSVEPTSLRSHSPPGNEPHTLQQTVWITKFFCRRKLCREPTSLSDLNQLSQVVLSWDSWFRPWTHQLPNPWPLVASWTQQTARTARF